MDELDDNQIENCNGCELAIETQQTPQLVSPEIELPPDVSVEQVCLYSLFTVDVLARQLDFAIYSRPPPFLI